MLDGARREVDQLHAFFTAWYVGSLPKTKEAFLRVERSLDEEFNMVGPEGITLNRDEILGYIFDGHGTRTEGKFRIWIEAFQAVPLAESLILASYEEWVEGAREVRGRASSAIMRASNKGPEGWVWIHLHETWLPPQRVRLAT